MLSSKIYKALYIVYLLALITALALGSEIILQKKGILPFSDPSKTEPHKTKKISPPLPLMKEDPVLGYVNSPGKYKITINEKYSYIQTNLPNGNRITHPISTYDKKSEKKEIWIFGCSFTYGATLNDEETYPWLLQEKFPEYEVVNFGVPGYGTIQSYLQLATAIKHKKPALVILAYSDVHDPRNVYPREYQKQANFNKKGAFNRPYARLDSDGKLKIIIGNPPYTEFPLIRSSSAAHYAEMVFNKYEERKLSARRVTELLISEMAKIAKENDSKFAVINIVNEENVSKIRPTSSYNRHAHKKSIMNFLRSQSINGLDISVDLTTPGYSNLPYDHHPSSNANRIYSDKIEEFIKHLLLPMG